MADISFVENLTASLDVPSINTYFRENRKKTEEVLRRLRPEGRIDANRFKLASAEGGAGGSFDFNLQNGHWGDWGAGDSRHGLVGFVSHTMRCSPAQAVDFLIKEKYLDKKDAKKALSDASGDPLVFPIPTDKQDWEVVLEADCVRKDRGIIKGHWTYRDMDGSLLGYKYRVDSRNTNKEVYTLTYRAEVGWVKKAWQKKLLPPYGLQALRDGPTIRVLLVEGEKAKDKAQEIFGERWKVLGYSGVKGADELWLPDEQFWEDCDVVIWPDNDEPGREAARKVQMALQQLAHKPQEVRIVRCETFAVSPGWDLGDWIDGCPVDPLVEIERAESIDSFERVSREWCYVAQEDKFYSLEDRQVILSPVAFDRNYTRYGDKTGTPSKKFLSSLETNRAVDLDFLPGYDTFINTPNGKLLLNEWYPSETYAMGKTIANNPLIQLEDIAEKAKYFIAHIDRISGGEIVESERSLNGDPVSGTEDRLLRDALCHFFSLAISRPTDKQGWIPVLVSEHNGTGKSYFRRVMSQILGGRRVQELTVPQYLSQYEDWMDGCLFYELNEAKSQATSEVYELLKKNHSYLPFNLSDLRDRAQGVRQVNIKGSRQKQQRNFMNGYITSNDLYPIALANSSGLDGSDRRLLAINCEEIISQIQADELFEELTHRPEWITAWLMRYKSPVEWNPGWAPITAHKRRMLEKDRERSENKNDKFELGKFDEFYHYVKWAVDERVAFMKGRVVTAEAIRSHAEAAKLRFPWSSTRFEALLQKAGLIKGPSATVQNVPTKLYSVDHSLANATSDEWMKALKQPIKSDDKEPF
mgnify:CR=1 FL=1